MDALKKTGADAVATMLRQIGDCEGMPTLFEMNRVTELQTSIRIPQDSGGPRYFLVTLREQL